MPQQTNQKKIEVVKLLFDEVYIKGNISALEKFCSNDLKLNDPAYENLKKGLQSYKELEIQNKIAFPNKNYKIDHIWSVDNHVITSWTCQGTHKGLFRDIPPTGKTFKLSGISIYQFSGDKIAEINQIWDQLGLLEQLGLNVNTPAYL